MSFDIGRSLYWLCTKSRDLVFRSIDAAAEYVAETMTRMRREDRWDDDFFERLAKVERRDDNWNVTGVSEEMWMKATLILWREENAAKKELDEVKMEVVRQYDKYRGGKTQ